MSLLFGLVTNSSLKRAGFDFRVIRGYLKPCDLHSVESTMTTPSPVSATSSAEPGVDGYFKGTRCFNSSSQLRITL